MKSNGQFNERNVVKDWNTINLLAFSAGIHLILQPMRAEVLPSLAQILMISSLWDKNQKTLWLLVSFLRKEKLGRTFSSNSYKYTEIILGIPFTTIKTAGLDMN